MLPPALFPPFALPPLPGWPTMSWPPADNAALDAVFYDVNVLEPYERKLLSKPGHDEGMVLEVGTSRAPSLRIWPGISECDNLAPSYAALSVAGVGSSGLGAAAFARNVADAVGGPVLAVVSGFGMKDLAAEALGGFYLFGGLNAARHMAQVFEPLTSFAPPWLQPIDPGHTMPIARRSKDVQALRELLEGRVKVPLLVGHSKGNLVISEALYAMRERDRDGFAALAASLDVVTFGARIAMPKGLASVSDVMGDLDGFGAFNSRPDIAVDRVVPQAWHHTNTALKFHVPVTRELRRLLAAS
ncbi:MAG: hypothetical protein AAF127_11630 [Pseudomonadota bacterium]